MLLQYLHLILPTLPLTPSYFLLLTSHIPCTSTFISRVAYLVVDLIDKPWTDLRVHHITSASRNKATHVRGDTIVCDYDTIV
jgi:hypothetical protein